MEPENPAKKIKNVSVVVWIPAPSKGGQVEAGMTGCIGDDAGVLFGSLDI
jgi:hypothetical protein